MTVTVTVIVTVIVTVTHTQRERIGTIFVECHFLKHTLHSGSLAAWVHASRGCLATLHPGGF